MRLVGVIATCFVLLSALIYGFQHRKEFGLDLVDRVESVLPSQVAAVDSHGLPVPSSQNEVILPMREAGRLNAFTGFPGYTKATFALPQSSTPQSGVLVLDLNGDLEPGAQGILRVVVNGVRRTDLVLDPGRLRREIMVPLNQRDLSGQSVIVALSAEGRAPQTECSAEWNGGIVAQIMPSSHVKLIVDAPLSAPADILATNAAPLRFEWPSDAGLRARALNAAHQQSFDRPGILFANSEGGGLALNYDLLTAFEEQAKAHQEMSRNPLDLAAALGRNRSVSFREETQWRMTFDRRAFQSGAAADQLDLAMTFDAAGDESGWLLSVFLNDRVVHSEAFPAASGKLARKIQLPTDGQVMHNELRVALTSAEARQGGCSAGRPAVADIKTAKLSLSENGPDGDWSEFQNVMSNDLHLKVHARLDALGAQLALDLMNRVMGGTALKLQTGRDHPANLPVMTVVPLTALANILGKVHGSTSWVVVPAKEGNQDVAIHRVADLEPGFFTSAPRAVLVIERQPHFTSAGAL